MKLIVGLGNPAKEYEQTRHNIGFWVLDELQSLFHLTDWMDFSKGESLLLRHPEFILAKPQTFMNDSGRAVSKLAHYYKISVDNIWIVHDDIDLPLGNIKVQPSGSQKNTHRGVSSVIEWLGTSDFPRFRVGIANDNYLQHKIPAEDYVLKRFGRHEEESARDSAKLCARIVAYATEKGISRTQSRKLDTETHAE